jgi:hypothetical protein
VYGKKKHVHNSSNNPPKFSLYYSRRRILEKTISKTLKRKRMKMMNERERESEKSSSITLAQDMVSERVRGGFLLYLERQTHLSWIYAKCPTPSKRGNP